MDVLYQTWYSMMIQTTMANLASMSSTLLSANFIVSLQPFVCFRNSIRVKQYNRLFYTLLS